MVLREWLLVPEVSLWALQGWLEHSCRHDVNWTMEEDSERRMGVQYLGAI
jgi:hypothetical protein